MKKTLTALILISALLLAGCSAHGNGEDPSANNGRAEGNVSAAVVDFAKDSSEMFTERDRDAGYDESSADLIQLNGSSASSPSDSVSVSGSTVTVTGGGTYIISGTLSDGTIIVDAEETDKPQLVLNDVNISSSDSAAIYISEADKVFITLADGTDNFLSNGGAFAAADGRNIDGAVFSAQDVTFNGGGTLTVNSPAGHGIVCKDDLKFTGGTYTVNSASHGLDANDSVRIADAELNIDAGKDGIHSENSDDASLGFIYSESGALNIDAEGDGISAGSYIQIEDGSINITSGGGSANGSMKSSDNWGKFMGGRPGANFAQSTVSDDSSTSIKGIKSTGGILINGGMFSIDSADDAVHSNSSVTVNGGNLELATGDDGVHADEQLTVTSGTINITESYEGLEAQNIEISGGSISILASDDGLNAAGGADASGLGGRGGDIFGGSSSECYIRISGGTIYVNAAGDGIDSNGSLEIAGGDITVSGPNSGDTSIIDYESSGTISGGTFIGMGASSMVQNFSSSSTQGAIMASVGTNGTGTAVSLSDADGNVLLSQTSDQSFSCVILSCPSIVKGDVYTLTVGASSTEITMDSLVYGAKSQGGTVDPGGRGGNGKGAVPFR